MSIRLAAVFPLISSLLAGSALAAPVAVEISLRIAAPASLGGFSVPQGSFNADLGNLQPDGSFALSNVQATSPVSSILPSAFQLSISNSYLVFNGPFALSGGSFAPGTGGFGGTAPVRALDNNEYFSDVFLGRDVLVNSGWLGALFGASGVVRAFAGAGTTHLSGAVGRWTTRALTIAGTHDVLGAFSTQVAGTDQRNASGVGFLSMVSPTYLHWVGECPPCLPGSDFPLFATLELNFVPEPATLAMLGVGLAGLAALRRTG